MAVAVYEGMRLLASLALAASLTACVVGDAGSESADLDLAGGKADATGTCKDTKYGDGTCHIGLETTCGVADIDCYTTFENATAARSWSEDNGLALVLASDPRGARARKLVDRAWTMFKARYPVGALSSKYLAAEVIDDPQANAFVGGNQEGNKQVFAVFIHAGLLTSRYSDDDILGAVAHELAHLARLHSFPEVQTSLTRYYNAGASEPIGALQPDRATARAAALRWKTLAEMVGSDSRIELGGLPTGGSQGDLFQYLLGSALTSTNATCKANALAARDLWVDIVTDRELDDSIAIHATTRDDAETVLELLAACPNNAFDALTSVVAGKRAELRALAAELASKGTPITKLRYFSYEEQADDFSVRVTHHAGLSTVGSSGVAVKILGANAGECEALRANNQVPYGDLLDPHHGMCWRLAHMHQYKASFGTQAAIHIDDADDVIEYAPIEPYVPTQRVNARTY